MVNLTMTGGKKGLLSISLIKAVRYWSQEAQGSLATAKRLVEDLMDGK